MAGIAGTGGTGGAGGGATGHPPTPGTQGMSGTGGGGGGGGYCAEAMGAPARAKTAMTPTSNRFICSMVSAGPMQLRAFAECS